MPRYVTNVQIYPNEDRGFYSVRLIFALEPDWRPMTVVIKRRKSWSMKKYVDAALALVEEAKPASSMRYEYDLTKSGAVRNEWDLP